LDHSKARGEKPPVKKTKVARLSDKHSPWRFSQFRRGSLFGAGNLEFAAAWFQRLQDVSNLMLFFKYS